MKQNPLRDTGWLLACLLIVGLVTVVIITNSRTRIPGASSATTSFGATVSAAATTTGVTTTPTRAAATVVPSPYPGPQDYLTATAAAWQTAAMPRLTQKAIMLATYLATTPSPAIPDTHFPTGTVENDVYTRSSGLGLGLITQNAWVGFVDGNRADLYAGALQINPTQGAIFLWVIIPNSGFVGLILTPSKHGGVRVVAEQNNRLTMVSTDGTAYFFDVPARRFVASLTEIVPSATPPATITPFPPPTTPSPSS